MESYIEKRLTEQMGPDFSMEAFMDALPDYIEKDAGGRAGEEASSDTIDFLLGFGDMESFKVRRAPLPPPPPPLSYQAPNTPESPVFIPSPLHLHGMLPLCFVPGQPT